MAYPLGSRPGSLVGWVYGIGSDIAEGFSLLGRGQ
jgi:hypothetical protein